MSGPAAPGRRRLLRGLALSPLALLSAPEAEAKDYASAAEVLEEIDALERDVGARLQALGRRLPAAGPFVASVLRDQERHRGERARVRRWLRTPPSRAAAAEEASEVSLAGLREAQQALVHAHAEGMPALGDPRAVDVLARHMAEGSRVLTVLDLWRETEE